MYDIVNRHFKGYPYFTLSSCFQRGINLSITSIHPFVKLASILHHTQKATDTVSALPLTITTTLLPSPSKPSHNPKTAEI